MCKCCIEHWIEDASSWGCESIFNNREFEEKSLDNYAYVGTQAWISDHNQLNVFTVADRGYAFVSTSAEFEINYCPMCGRDLRSGTE